MKKILVFAFLLLTLVINAQDRFQIISSKTSENGGGFSNFKIENGYVVFHNLNLQLNFKEIHETFVLIRNISNSENYKGTYSEELYYSPSIGYVTFILHIAVNTNNVYLYMYTDENYIVELKLIQ